MSACVLLHIGTFLLAALFFVTFNNIFISCLAERKGLRIWQGPAGLLGMHACNLQAEDAKKRLFKNSSSACCRMMRAVAVLVAHALLPLYLSTVLLCVESSSLC